MRDVENNSVMTNLPVTQGILLPTDGYNTPEDVEQSVHSEIDHAQAILGPALTFVLWGIAGGLLSHYTGVGPADSPVENIAIMASIFGGGGAGIVACLNYGHPENRVSVVPVTTAAAYQANGQLLDMDEIGSAQQATTNEVSNSDFRNMVTGDGKSAATALGR